MEAGGYRTKLLPEQPELTEKPEQPELPEKLLPEVKTNHELIDPKNPECIDTKFRLCRMIVIKWRYDVSKVNFRKYLKPYLPGGQGLP